MLRPFLIAAALLLDPLLAQEAFPVELTASTSTPDRDGKFILRPVSYTHLRAHET